MTSSSLSELVTIVADNPTIENRNKFYHSLLISKVGARIDNPDSRYKPGTYITTKNDKIGIPSTKGPDGKPWLLVFCDIPRMCESQPNATFIEIDGRIVLEMAQKAGCGIIVQNMVDGRESWAGVLSEHISGILRGKENK